MEISGWILVILVIWVVGAIIQSYLLIRFGNLLASAGNTPGPVPRDGISVVVCANRTYPDFERLLERLSQQSYPNYEVIIVNDGADPEISQMLVRHEGVFREIAFVRTNDIPAGKKAPLAAGIAASRHPWILLTDADCMVDMEWVLAMRQAAQSQYDIVLGYGPYYPGQRFSERLARLDVVLIAIQYLSAAISGRPYMGVGRNLMYRKALYEAAGGFESHKDLMSGDDDLFVQQIATAGNTTVCLQPASYAWSAAPGSLGQLLRQKRRHVSTGVQYRARARWHIALFTASYICAWLMPLLLILVTWNAWFLLGAVIVAAMQCVLFARACRPLGEQNAAVQFVRIAPFYATYQIILGILAAIGPGTKWK